MFSKINLANAYSQIPVAADDIRKTAFIAPFGLCEFLLRHFGLSDAVQTLQRFVGDVF